MREQDTSHSGPCGGSCRAAQEAECKGKCIGYGVHELSEGKAVGRGGEQFKTGYFWWTGGHGNILSCLVLGPGMTYSGGIFGLMAEG